MRDSISATLTAECTRLAVHAFVDGRTDLTAALWSHARELGWLGVGLPDAYGGVGLGAKGLQVLHTELGRHIAPGPYLATLSAAQWLEEVGSEAQKRRYLPKIVGGECSVAIPMVFMPQARSQRGPLRLLGSRYADMAVVPWSQENHEGWALVPLTAGQARSVAGWDFTRELIELDTDGLVPDSIISDLDGRVGDRLLAQMLTGICSDSMGAARAIADQTVDYLKTRVQFGKPIGSFQALKHRAADLFALLAHGDHLVDQAIEALDENADSLLWAAIGKAGVTDAFTHIAADCVQLHGGIGFTWEYDCHLFLKRARLNEALGASNAALRDLGAERFTDALKSARAVLELRAL